MSEDILFGTGLKQLEEIVRKMENDEYSLEEMVQKFQEGMQLYSTLQKKLTDVELQISTVLSAGNNSQQEKQ